MRQFFHGFELKEVEMNMRDGRPAGFCHIEVNSLQDLKDVLEANGVNFQGRQLKVDVAGAQRKRNNFGGGAGGGDDGPQREVPDFRSRSGPPQQRRQQQQHRGGREERGPREDRREQAPQEKAAPRERKKLNLAARTVPTTAPSSGAGASIFGGGRTREETIALRAAGDLPIPDILKEPVKKEVVKEAEDKSSRPLSPGRLGGMRGRRTPKGGRGGGRGGAANTGVKPEDEKADKSSNTPRGGARAAARGGGRLSLIHI